MALSNPIEFDIEKLVYGGDGLARLDPAAVGGNQKTGGRGKAVFIPFVLPGERVRAVIEEQARGYSRARALQILIASPERTQPGCEYFGRCGGCHVQHAVIDYQRQLKSQILRETIARTGGITWDEEIKVHASPAWEYRNRTRLRFAASAESPRPKVGYYHLGSHKLLEITHCPITSPLLNRAITAARALPTPPASARELELFADDRVEELIATLYVANIGPQERDYARSLALPGCSSVAVATESRRELVYGPGHLAYTVGRWSYRVSHGSFFQVNRCLIADLQDEVTRGQSGTVAIDLFSGVGLFTAPLAEGFASVHAVESNANAMTDLRFNADGYTNIHPASVDALEFMQRWRGDIELLVADPPRAGIGPKLTTAVLRVRPARIHLVSCDPATLARDLKQLRSGGYGIREIHLFDLFPQTFHIESLVKLSIT